MAEKDTRALEARLGEVAARLELLEARVARLEPRTSAAAAAVERGQDEALTVPELPQGTLAFVGRTLLVLAGAYAIRALADGDVVPAWVGIALGICYAVAWQFQADREAAAGRVQSAAFHDLASSLIAFPLVWESAGRFGLLSPAAASVALVAFFGLGLTVAWRRRLPVNAAVTTLLTLATAVAVLISTHDLLAAIAALLAACAGLEWLATRGAWPALRWAGVAVLDAIAFLLIAVATRPELPAGYPAFSPAAAALALLGLPALHVVSVATRAIRLGRPVTTYDVLQGGAAGLLGLGGAVRVLEVHGAPATPPAAVAVLLGLACYAAAFVHAERRPTGSRNFYFFSTCGALLVGGGTSLMGLDGSEPVVWSAAGMLAAGLGRRFDRMTLRVHGALFLALAAVQSGLLAGCAATLGGTAQPPLAAAAWTTAVAASVAWLVLATDPAASRDGASRIPQLLLAIVVVVVVGRAVHAVLCGALGSGLAEDVGSAAFLRTAVLAGLALALALASRSGSWPELGWLVYPLLVLGGIKLLAQDLRDGRPATLVLSLAVYGLVLTVAPRLMRARSS